MRAAAAGVEERGWRQGTDGAWTVMGPGQGNWVGEPLVCEQRA